MVERRGTRLFLATLVIAAVWATTRPAQAQQILVGQRSQYDKVRLSGFLWRAKPQGTLRLAELASVPGFARGIDIADGLGFDSSANGWIIEGNVAPGRRHHLIFEYSRLQASGARTVEFPGFSSIPGFSIDTTSDITLREFHAFYNFLLAASPQAEFGVLGGLGWFETQASLFTDIGSAAAMLDQAFPAFGANLMLNPKGPLRGYVELSGFPRVEVNDLSGWQFDLVARFEVFPARNFGLIVGYRRYRLVFDEGEQNIGLDVIWDGFTFGAQVRY